MQKLIKRRRRRRHKMEVDESDPKPTVGVDGGRSRRLKESLSILSPRPE